MATKTRHAERVVNEAPGPPDDGKARRVDTCPTCGAERWELLVVPDVFYCEKCRKSTVGPNTAVVEAEPEQIDLFGATVSVPSNEGAKQEHPAEEAPPVDE